MYIQEGDFFTFCNIDGEYFKFRNPDVITIKLTDKVPKGKLRILVRDVKSEDIYFGGSDDEEASDGSD